ncbi:hypothetical protein GGI15_000597 [Coemansia interrupta]|uniref:Uncharacterized protein n=1 Tax=Coemansia interrupta TaxID=1126814 RepID=A0A9W8HSS1_9FUNG|nr:hypothetical protein GGI15_000597 [Coemansia interrupta]
MAATTQTAPQSMFSHHDDPTNPQQRRRVRQLSSVKAWCRTNGMELDDDSCYSEVSSYQSFPDLRRLLEEECAEIERKELVAKASLEARIRRRNSDALSDECSEGGSGTASPSGRSSDYGSPSGIMGSLYRFIDPIIPVLGTASAKDSSTTHA